MSDFYDENNRNNNEYSYSHEQINQGETHYQWTPGNDPKKPKEKKEIGFGRKLLRAGSIALVFGLVAGISFQSVVYVSNKYMPQTSTAEVEQLEETVAEEEKTAAENTSVAQATATSATALDVSNIVDSVMPAIVQVTNVSLATYQTWFGQQYQQENTSCGSGIIISQDSENIYIATNNHVVSGAQTLTITFTDDSSVEGKIKGTDSSCDLAVVEVKIADISADTMSKIKVATIGSSDALSVGDGCIVIGNALGYGQSVTTGVISAIGREVTLQDDNGNTIKNSLIQTDAAVNPGNSGGAMLNTDGEVIGIVSAKLSNEQVEGMGYAIPISYASSIIEQMINSDVVSDLEAAYIGIAGTDITEDMSQQYSMPVGVYVQRVVEGSGAEAAGIEAGDVITAINDREVTGMNTISNILQYLKAGTTVDITVAKGNNNYEEVTLQVTLTNKNETIQ